MADPYHGNQGRFITRHKAHVRKAMKVGKHLALGGAVGGALLGTRHGRGVLARFGAHHAGNRVGRGVNRLLARTGGLRMRAHAAGRFVRGLRTPKAIGRALRGL